MDTFGMGGVMKSLPYKYQIKAARAIHRFNGRALLADEMGTGKSAEVLLYCENHNTKPILVVCPAGVKYNWQRECEQHFGWYAEVIDGTEYLGRRLIPPDITIVNYDILMDHMEYLLSLGFKTLILDECHYCGNRGSKRTKACRELSKRAKHVIGLSGTPLTNRPAELWPILNMVRPDLYSSPFGFLHLFCNPRKTPWGWQFRGATKLKRLHKELTENLMIRRTKEEVLKELPRKQREVMVFDVKERGEYDHALNDFIGWLRKQGQEKLRSASKAEKIAQLVYLKQLIGVAKVPHVLEWVDNLLATTKEKIILFAVHKKVVEELSKKYRKNCVVVDGSKSSKQRKEAVEKFRTSKQTRVFIGNIRAAGTGINLQVASTVVFCEIGWTPGEHDQCESRAHRLNQKKITRIYYLIARDSLEEKLLKIIQDKQQVLSKTLDGKGRSQDFDVYDRLCREVLKGK